MPARRRLLLTFDDELGGAGGVAGGAVRLRRELAGVLVEHLGDRERVRVARLRDLEVGRADDVRSLAVPRHRRRRRAAHAHRERHRRALAHLARLQPLDELRRHQRRCEHTGREVRRGRRCN